MRQVIVGSGFVGLLILLGACSHAPFQTLKIFDSPTRVVALQVMPEPFEGKGYDHPVSFSTHEITRLLQGLRIEGGILSSQSHPALSETEIKLFAPHFVKALQQATNEEMVTFFETAEISDERQITTSGGLFVGGGNLHVVLSNFSVKTPIWQDNEQYEASYKNRPLERIDPQPGRLVYEPREYMVESPQGEIGSRVKGKPWQVAIRYRDLLKTK